MVTVGMTDCSFRVRRADTWGGELGFSSTEEHPNMVTEFYNTWRTVNNRSHRGQFNGSL